MRRLVFPSILLLGAPVAACDFHDFGPRMMGFGGIDDDARYAARRGDTGTAVAIQMPAEAAADRMARLRRDLLARTPGLAAVSGASAAPETAAIDGSPSR